MIVLMFVVISFIFLGVACIATEDNAKDAANEWVRTVLKAGVIFVGLFTFLMALVFIWAMTK